MHLFNACNDAWLQLDRGSCPGIGSSILQYPKHAGIAERSER
jgi:hypothetical protein